MLEDRSKTTLLLIKNDWSFQFANVDLWTHPMWNFLLWKEQFYMSYKEIEMKDKL